MLGHRPLRLQDYFGILKRRGWLALIPLAIVPLVAVAFSYTITPQYLSKTLVLIESQKVSDTIVKSVVSENLDSRLASMKERILSRSSLQPIIERYNLYADDKLNMDERIDRTRKNIGIEPITPEVSHSNGLPGFFISFKDGDPHNAQQICTEITSLFVQQNLQSHEESTAGTLAFLQSRLTEAKRNLDDQDARLKEFQQRNLGKLPDQEPGNTSMLASLNTQLDASTQALSGLQREKTFAETMLSQQLGPGSTATSSESPKNNAPVPAGPTDLQEKQLLDLQSRKAELLSQYTPSHPDVLAVDRQIKELRAEIARNPPIPRPGMVSSGPGPTQRESIGVQQLRAQIKAADVAIASKREEQARIQGQIGNYQARLEANPTVSEEYKQLTRDYQTSQQSYDDLLGKINTAEAAAALEKRQQGEQFHVMDAANLPDQPFSPKRGAFLAGGLAAGLLLGVIFVAWREFKDTAIREEFDIQYFLSLPTLTTLAFSAEVPQATKPGKLFRFFFRRAPRSQQSMAQDL